MFRPDYGVRLMGRRWHPARCLPLVGLAYLVAGAAVLVVCWVLAAAVLIAMGGGA